MSNSAVTGAEHVERPTMRDNPYNPRLDLKIWMDGELVPAAEARVSVFDHALLYGDGCFEGIRIYNGKIWKEKEHLDRFALSLKVIALDIGMTMDQVSVAMHEAMEANGLTGDGYIRLLATRGVGSLGISVKHTANPSVIVIADKIQLYPPKLYETGLRCIVSSYIRNHPNSSSPRVKSLNYLNNIMAKLDAAENGADEAIMLNHLGNVAEGTGDNLFCIRDGEISTPPVSDGILNGVTRNHVMKLAKDAGYAVCEQSLIRHDLYAADEIFLTGTAAEIISVVSVDRRQIGDGRPGPITAKLTALFKQSIAAA